MGERSSMMVTSSGAIGNVPTAPSGPERMHAVTREDGSFELIVDGPGRYHGVFSTEGRRASFPGRELDIPDVEAYSVDFAFTGVPVSGTVVDEETSQPVVQAWLSATRRGGDKVASVGGRTGPEGRFEFDAAPGDYRLSAQADGYAQTMVDLKVGPDGAADVRVELEKGLGIEGRVVDAAGRGLSGVLLQALAVLGPKDEARAGGRTRPDGTFTIEGLRPGSYTLCAGSELAGYALRTGVAPGGKDVTLTVRPAGKVLVRVLAADDSPIPESWTEVTKVNGNPVSVPVFGRGPADANGVTEFATPTGTVEVTARKEKRKGTASVAVGEGATVPVELRLTEPDDAFP
jgi:hypothetical protein